MFKIQLEIANNFISCNVNNETMINDKADEVTEKFFNQFFPGIKLGWKHKLKIVISYLIVFIY